MLNAKFKFNAKICYKGVKNLRSGKTEGALFHLSFLSWPSVPREIRKNTTLKSLTPSFYGRTHLNAPELKAFYLFFVLFQSHKSVKSSLYCVCGQRKMYLHSKLGEWLGKYSIIQRGCFLFWPKWTHFILRKANKLYCNYFK